MPAHATITCLVADDNALMRQAVAACLGAEQGVELLGTADDGDHLLELIERHEPHTVIADAHMPRLGGIAVCRAVAERFPQVGVILYTGLEEIDLLEAALEAGARGFLVKSGSPTELVRSVRVVAGGGTYVDGGLMGALAKRLAAHRGHPLSGRELEVLGLLAEAHALDDEQVACAADAMQKLGGDAAGRLWGTAVAGRNRQT